MFLLIFNRRNNEPKKISFRNYLSENNLPEFEKNGNLFVINLKNANDKFIDELINEIKNSGWEIVEAEFLNILEIDEFEENPDFNEGKFWKTAEKWFKTNFSEKVIKYQYIPNKIKIKENPQSLKYDDLVSICSSSIIEQIDFTEKAQNGFYDIV